MVVVVVEACTVRLPFATISLFGRSNFFSYNGILSFCVSMNRILWLRFSRFVGKMRKQGKHFNINEFLLTV